MNNYINARLQEFAEKINGYSMLFNYRMMNLCVKAEPAALVPVIVTIGGKQCDLEEVAEIRRPDDYHFEIRVKNERPLQNIIEGIMDVHPEFIMEKKTEKDLEDKEVLYLSYKMPPVNKDRHDLLSDTTKVFYDECVANIEAAHTKQEALFVEALLHAPVDEANEAKDGVKTLYDNGKDEAEKLYNAKIEEIENAYQDYLSSDQENDDTEDFDFSKGMRFGRTDY
jgi:ribosome recycling factor